MDRIEYRGKDEWMPYVIYVLRLPKNTVICAGIYCILACLFPLVIFQTYLFLRIFEIGYFLRYGPFYFLTLFILTTTVVQIQSYKTYYTDIQHFKDTFFWSASLASDNTRKKIMKESKWFQIMYFVKIFLASCLLDSSLYAWTNNPTKVFAISEVICSNYAEWYAYFHWPACVMFQLSTVIAISSISYLHYLLLYLKFQIYMLIDTVEAIDNLAWQENQYYDKYLSRYLRFFIRRHGDILEFSRLMREKGLAINILFLLSSPLIGLYTIFAFFSDISRFVTLTAFVTYGIILTTTANEIQLFEDNSEDLAMALYDLKWYLWKRQNMKTYVLIHKYTSTRIVKMPLPWFISCNLTILKTFAQFMYAVANIFHTMRNVQ